MVAKKQDISGVPQQLFEWLKFLGAAIALAIGLSSIGMCPKIGDIQTVSAANVEHKEITDSFNTRLERIENKIDTIRDKQQELFILLHPSQPK